MSNESATEVGRTGATADPQTGRLRYAQVLVEIGDLAEAEREIADVLEQDPKSLTAFNLLAKIKHMRGELSQAIACWAQIHAHAAHAELAQMCLASIFQFVKHPERGGDLALLSHFRISRKPAARLELENAFRLFLAQHTDEARAVCDRLAVAHERSDREVFKLAMLASAWIAELAGDLYGACRVLERLGTQRGFETDTDRVLALARVCERIGTAEHLERAAHIFRFFERTFEKMSALARLAEIHRRLGNAGQAEEYTRRYLAAFQKRMHRLSTAEVAEVAATRFIPLEKLRRVRVAADAPRDESLASVSANALMTTRERAVAAYMVGETRAARELFARGDDLLDAKYAANLDLLEGRAARGVGGLIAALERDPDDVRVLRALLDRYEASHSEEIVSALSRPDVRDKLVTKMCAVVRISPRNPSAWRNLATLRAILGDASEAARCETRAAALFAAQARDGETVGRVLAAAVFHFVGKSKGLIHQIWVDRMPAAPRRGGFLAPDGILGNVTPEMRHGIRNTFLAVREYARTHFPQQTADVLDYDYTYKITKEDEPSGGLSAGLPTAMAFLSVFLQKPVPQDVAYSGVLIADSHDVLVVRAVGDVECKVKGAYNRNLRMLVLPADNRPDMLANSHLPKSVCDEIVRYARDLDDAVTLTFGEDVWLK
jgi:tetratricopeptide (TPR) repeat protein